MNLQTMAVIISAIGVMLAIVGGTSRLFGRIGKLEGKIEDKLNGAFTKVCKDVEELKTNEIPHMHTELMVLRSDTNLLRKDVNIMKPEISEIKEHVAAIRGQLK